MVTRFSKLFRPLCFITKNSGIGRAEFYNITDITCSYFCLISSRSVLPRSFDLRVHGTNGIIISGLNSSYFSRYQKLNECSISIIPSHLHRGYPSGSNLHLMIQRIWSTHSSFDHHFPPPSPHFRSFSLYWKLFCIV
jgi:hypothetical protein